MHEDELLIVFNMIRVSVQNYRRIGMSQGKGKAQTNVIVKPKWPTYRWWIWGPLKRQIACKFSDFDVNAGKVVNQLLSPRLPSMIDPWYVRDHLLFMYVTP